MPSSPDPKLIERIGAVAGKVPGVALVVVGAEGVRARGSTGYADLLSHAPMTTGVVAPWFSMTKIATATLALRLAEAGTIELDEPVAGLVPKMTFLQPSEWARKITPRHLLQHSAGLRNPLPVRWVHPAAEPPPDPEAFLTRLLSTHRKLRWEPGARTSYSNLGALILGAALTARTGRAFDALMRTEILEPLGMTATGFGDELKGAPRATGYHPRGNPLRYFLPGWVRGDPVGRWLTLEPFALDGAPYGGLVGTADDAARFLQMHLSNGGFQGRVILGPEVASDMRRISLQGKRYDLGLGWFRPASRRDSTPGFVEHLGGGAGFFNCMRAYPTKGVGAIVVGNATRYDVDSVAALALDYAG
ncbi:MAG: serine hydrolase domain-containing protein [Actinomycetota bacterium]